MAELDRVQAKHSLRCIFSLGGAEACRRKAGAAPYLSHAAKKFEKFPGASWRQSTNFSRGAFSFLLTKKIPYIKSGGSGGRSPPANFWVLFCENAICYIRGVYVWVALEFFRCGLGGLSAISLVCFFGLAARLANRGWQVGWLVCDKLELAGP